MNKPIYLISGATGVTGGYAIESLLAAGQSIRALVHREDERSDALKAKGVELFVGDFADFRAIRKAMHGITGAYFCYPIAPGIVQATAQFAQAAKESAVGVIVNMSQVIVREYAGSNASLQHWLSERVFDWSGAPSVHLRPAFFAEWLLYMAPMIAQGTIYASYAQGKTAFIAAEDQGRVIAEILKRPLPHLGQTYPLYGPTEYTFAELAQEVGRVLGRPIGYQQVPFDTMRAAFLPSGHGIARNDSYSGYAESATTDSNGETFVAQHLREASEDHHHGLFAGTNKYVEQITGQPPMTIEAFVSKHRAYFGQEAAGK